MSVRLKTLRHPALSVYFAFMAWEMISVISCGILTPYAVNPLLDMAGSTIVLDFYTGALIGLFPLSLLFIAPMALGTYVALAWI